jgi:hypothetical protein
MFPLAGKSHAHQAVDEEKLGAVVFLQAGPAAGPPFFFFTLPAEGHESCAEHALTGPMDGLFQSVEKPGKTLIFEEPVPSAVEHFLGPGNPLFDRRLQRRLSRGHTLFLAFPAFPFTLVLR